MLAAYTHVPEMALEKDEARAMAEAIANVSKHYKIPGMSPEHAALAQLGFILAVTYGKRIPNVMARRKNGARPASATVARPVSSPETPPTPEPWFSGLQPSDSLQ